MLTVFDIIFICVVPIICALIGYATNVIAVKMLFKPKKPKKILFFSIQGLVPRRQTEIALNFARIVSTELVTANEISTSFQTDDIQEKLIKAIDEEITKFIGSKLTEISPLITAFISPDLIIGLKTGIMKEIEAKLPELIENFKGEISTNFDIKTVVENKIKNFNLDQLENIILAVSKRELKQIERLGGLLGFIIGLFQSAVYLISQLV